MKALLVLMFFSGAALADDAALLRCRELADGPGRLACYNAIPVVAKPVAGPAGAAPAMVTVAPGYAVAAPARADLENMFGRETSVMKSIQLNELETSIAGPFDGWVAGQRIRLANGQVWKVVDGSDDVMELRDPKVTIKRGLLGAIFLDIEGAHRNPKVQRVQ
jgi:hypothetical protein